MIEQTRVKVPGKLYIAGEYAVVTPGESAILIAVNRYVTVTLDETSNGGSIVSEHYPNNRTWSSQNEGKITISDTAADDVVASAMAVIARYAYQKGEKLQEVQIKIDSELDSASGQKYGLGSSGALTVAMVRAFSRRLGWNLSDLEVFKLALISVWRVEPKSSGGDIAASTFGGWIKYTSPEKVAQKNSIDETDLLDQVACEWRKLAIVRLPDPQTIGFNVCWSGQPAKTKTLVEKRITRGSAEATFRQASTEAVEELAQAIFEDNPERIFAALNSSKNILMEHMAVTNPNYLSAKLLRIEEIAAKYGLISKVSGAGGGDCAIVFRLKHTPVTRMLREWALDGMLHLEISADTAGEGND